MPSDFTINSNKPPGLRADQYEWQFANPSSSVARAGFRPGGGHFRTRRRRDADTRAP